MGIEAAAQLRQAWPSKSNNQGREFRSASSGVRPFAHDVSRLLVGTKPEIDRLAELDLARPFREFYLGDE
jgi:hypothetical protein